MACYKKIIVKIQISSSVTDKISGVGQNPFRNILKK